MKFCACGCGAQISEIGVHGKPIRFARNHNGSPARTHGCSKTLAYKAWTEMIRRCSTVTAQAYQRYGGRGITVCERWRRYENFLADMGPRPDGMTLDRIDNDGNYELGNCRWATPYEQSNNRRNNVALTLNGETHNVAEWARRAGLSKMTIHRRIAAGLKAEQILTLPAEVGRDLKERVNGKQGKGRST